MKLTYYKRYRMECPLTAEFLPLAEPQLPEGYSWVPWHPHLWSDHALVKYLCFADELDSRIFPCLGEINGCERLMREIASRFGFLPAATWLIDDGERYVATVQGVVETRVGMIQNLGVIPDARGLGLGSALLRQALKGFAAYGATKATLEVTAVNTPAVKLYRRSGFRRVRTLFKAAENSQPVW